jgi:hypothetical protein
MTAAERVWVRVVCANEFINVKIFPLATLINLKAPKLLRRLQPHTQKEGDWNSLRCVLPLTALHFFVSRARQLHNGEF